MLWPFSLVLVYCVKKNLATLLESSLNIKYTFWNFTLVYVHWCYIHSYEYSIFIAVSFRRQTWTFCHQDRSLLLESPTPEDVELFKSRSSTSVENFSKPATSRQQRFLCNHAPPPPLPLPTPSHPQSLFSFTLRLKQAAQVIYFLLHLVTYLSHTHSLSISRYLSFSLSFPFCVQSNIHFSFPMAIR
jgi:hypothetical protein